MKYLFVPNDPPYGAERCYRAGAAVGVCSTCMDARGLADQELIEGTHRGSLAGLSEWTQWADKVLVF